MRCCTSAAASRPRCTRFRRKPDIRRRNESPFCSFTHQGAPVLKKLLVVLAAIAAMALTSGCSTLADSRAAKGTGVAREYAAPIDVVWKTLPTVLAELSLPMVADNRQEGYIL